MLHCWELPGSAGKSKVVIRIQTPHNGTFEEVLDQFSSTYPNCTVARIGHGNINDTFLVTALAGKFILQRISAAVFPEPLHVQLISTKSLNTLKKKLISLLRGGDLPARFILTEEIFSVGMRVGTSGADKPICPTKKLQ